MKRNLSALLMILLAAPLTGFAEEQLVPAGSLLSCTVSEPRLSSKTTNIGDPVLCKVSHVELYGRSTLPYGTYMVGRFEDYRDPGHFVGKGWMELKFDRMVIPPDTIIPVEARVVAVPGYNVDRYGRILGKGHATRDTVMWMIPILWPIDLINLPRRGPRPTLKQETRLTLKVMDDFGVPQREAPQEVSPGLLRRPSDYQPSDYQPEPPPPPQQQPVAQNYSQPAYQPPPAYQQPVVQIYMQPAYQPPPVVTYVQPMYVPLPTMYVMPPAMPTYYYQAPAMYQAPAVAQAAGPYWGSEGRGYYYRSRY
jgi:hypothetical protein